MCVCVCVCVAVYSACKCWFCWIFPVLADDSDDMQRDTRNDIQIDHDHQAGDHMGTAGDSDIYSQLHLSDVGVVPRSGVQDAQAYQKALGTAKTSDELSLGVRLFDGWFRNPASQAHQLMLVS